MTTKRKKRRRLKIQSAPIGYWSVDYRGPNGRFDYSLGAFSTLALAARAIKYQATLLMQTDRRGQADFELSCRKNPSNLVLARMDYFFKKMERGNP